MDNEELLRLAQDPTFSRRTAAAGGEGDVSEVLSDEAGEFSPEAVEMEDVETIFPAGGAGRDVFFDDGERPAGYLPVYRDAHADTLLEPVPDDEVAAAGLSNPFPLVERLRDNYLLTSASDPAKVAEWERMASETGIPRFMLEGGGAPLEEAERRLRELEAYRMDFADVARNFPITSRFLADRGNMERAWRDVPRLKEAEGWIATALRAHRRGVVETELSQLMGKKAIYGSLVGPVDERIGELRAELDSLGDGPEGGFASWLWSAFITLPQMERQWLSGGGWGAALGAAAGAAAATKYGALIPFPEEAVTVPAAALYFGRSGFLAGAMSTAFEIETGAAYDEFLEVPGVSEAAARVAAVSVGVVNSGIEALEAASLLSGFPGGKEALNKLVGRAAMKEALADPTVAKALGAFAKRYAKGLTFETAQEMLQEVVNIVGGRALKAYTGAPQDSLAEEAARIAAVGAESFKGFSLISLAGPAASLARDARRVRRGRSAYKLLSESARAADLLADSDMGMDKAREFAKEVVAGSPAERVFIPGRTLAELQQSGHVQDYEEFLSETLGLPGESVADAVREADELGNYLEVEGDRLLFVPEPLRNELLREAKFSPEELSENERAVVSQELEARRNADLQLALAEAAELEREDKQGAFVRETVSAQVRLAAMDYETAQAALRKDGKVSEAEFAGGDVEKLADAAGRIMEAVSKVSSREWTLAGHKLNPREWLAEQGLSISFGAANGALRQEADVQLINEFEARYNKALADGDEEAAKRIVAEFAAVRGYAPESDYRMNHRAPGPQDKDVTLSLAQMRDGESIVPDDFFYKHPEYYMDTDDPATAESLGKFRSALEKGGRVTVYRAVSTEVEEGAPRNGDWVTFSKKYARKHGEHSLNGKYKVQAIKADVKDLYWDGNDVNEIGFDDGKDYAYKNTANNRKLFDAVVYDDKGNVVPLSERFQEGRKETFYQPVNAGVDLNEMVRGVVVTPALLAEDASRVKTNKFKKEFARKIAGTYRNDDTGWDIGMSISNVSHAVNSALKNNVTAFETSINILEGLPSIIRNAKLIESHADRYGHEHVKQVHRLFSSIKLSTDENTTYTVKLTVKEMDGKYVAEIDSIYRAYDAKVERKASNSARGPLPLNGVQNRHTSEAYDISIEEMLKSVNDNAKAPDLARMPDAHNEVPTIHRSGVYKISIGDMLSNVKDNDGNRYLQETFYQPVNSDVDGNSLVNVVDLANKNPGEHWNYDKLKAFIDGLVGTETSMADSKAIVKILQENARHIAGSSRKYYKTIDPSVRTDAVRNVKDLIESAVLIESMPNEKKVFITSEMTRGQRKNARRKNKQEVLHRLYVPLNIGDGNIYTVRIVVFEEDGKVGFDPLDTQLYDVLIDKKDETFDRSQTQTNLLSVGKKVPSEISIHDLLKNVPDSQGVPYFTQGARGSITVGERLDKDGNVLPRFHITLSRDANKSTVFHEFGHLFFYDLSRRAALPDATERTRRDFETLKGWLGWQDGQSEWTTEQHEQFARGFEAYLFEGRAPSVELRSVFRRIRDWMVRLYRELRSLNVELSDEVRGVFDRLLATDAAIDEAKAAMAIEADNDLSLLDDEARGRTEAARRDAYSAAQEDLQSRVLREATAKAASAWRRAFKKLEPEVRKRTAESGVYLHFETMRQAPDLRLSSQEFSERYGEEALSSLPADVVSEDGLALDTAAAAMGFSSADEMSRAFLSARPFEDEVRARTDAAVAERYPEKVMSPENLDLLAGEALLKHLELDENVEKERAALKAAADKLGVPVDDVLSMLDQENQAGYLTMASRTRRLIHQFLNEGKRTKKRLEELKGKLEEGSSDNKRFNPAMQSAADLRVSKVSARKEAADAAIGQKLYTEAVRPAPYLAAAERYRRRAIKYALEEDSENYFRFRELESVNMAMAKSAREAADEMGAAHKYLLKYANRGAKQNFGIAARYLDQIDALLARFDLRKRRWDPEANRPESVPSLASFAEELEREGELLLIPESMRNEGFRVPFSRMTVEEIRDLRDIVKNIEHVGRSENRLYKIKGMENAATAIRIICDRIMKYHKVGTHRVLNPTPDAKLPFKEKSARGKAAAVSSALNPVEYIMREIDGYEDLGPTREFLYESVNNADSDEEVIFKKKFGELHDIFVKYYGRDIKVTDERGRRVAFKDYKVRFDDVFLYTDEYDAEKKEYVRTDKPLELTFDQWIAFVLNMGNEGNRQRMENWGFSGKDIENVVNAGTERDLEFIQEVWDYLESFKPMIQETHRILTGTSLRWVEPSPLKTKYGTLRGGTGTLPGGYYPIVTDARYNEKAASRQELEALMDRTRFAHSAAFTKHGFRKERAERVTGAPPKLDLSVLDYHVANVIHDSCFSVALRDVQKVFRSRDVQNAIVNAVGMEKKEAINRWLQDMAAGKRRNAIQLTGIDRAVQGITANVATSTLGGAIVGPAAQVLGYFPLIHRLGFVNFLYGVSRYVRHPMDYWSFAVSRSGYLQKNMDAVRDAAVQQMRDVWSYKGKADRFSAQVKAFSLAAFPLCQNLCNVPGWYVSYEVGMKRYGGDEAKAARYADMAISTTQGGGRFIDQTLAERSSPWNRVVMMFWSWFRVQCGMQNEAFRRVFKERSLASVVNLGSYVFWVLLAQQFAEAWIRGERPDKEDEEGMLAQFADDPAGGALWLAKKAAVGAASPYPVVGPAASYFSNGGRFRLSPVSSRIESSLRLVKQAGGMAASVYEYGFDGMDWEEEDFYKLANGAAELYSLKNGLPIQRFVKMGEAFLRAAEGEDAAALAWDVVRNRRLGSTEGTR